MQGASRAIPCRYATSFCYETPTNLAGFLCAISLLLSSDIRAQPAARSENQFLYNEALRASLEVDAANRKYIVDNIELANV